MKPKIIQIIPAQPGHYMLYKDGERDPIIMWGLTEDGIVVGLTVYEDGVENVEETSGFYGYSWD